MKTVESVLFGMRLVRGACIAAFAVGVVVGFLGYVLSLWCTDWALEPLVSAFIGGPLAFGSLYCLLAFILNIHLNRALVISWKAGLVVTDSRDLVECRAWCRRLKFLHVVLCSLASLDLVVLLNTVCPEQKTTRDEAGGVDS